jgi:hypothetical protein
VQFDQLHQHTLDDAYQKLLLNRRQSEILFIRAAFEIILPQDAIEEADVEADLLILHKNLCTKIFHARSAAVIKEWNKTYTSRSVNKSHVCSLREFLK